MALDPLTAGLDLGGTVLKIAGQVLDRTLTDKNALARAKAEMEAAVLEAIRASDASQAATNTAEAGNPNLFVSGWRPFVGWVCGAGFAWAFVLGPVATTLIRIWQPGYLLPVLDTGSLTAMLTGMLGLAGLRTKEKLEGVASAVVR